MCVYIYIYIYIYTPSAATARPHGLSLGLAGVSEAQKCPLRRSALGVCPCSDPWGDTPPSRNKTLLGP